MLYCVLLFNHQLYDILFQKLENTLPLSALSKTSLFALCLPQKKNSELYIDLENRCVEGYGIRVDREYSSELNTFIRERYKFLEEEDEYVFINGLNDNTATMAVCYEYDSDFEQYAVVYLPLFSKGIDTKELAASFENIAKKRMNK